MSIVELFTDKSVSTSVTSAIHSPFLEHAKVVSVLMVNAFVEPLMTKDKSLTIKDSLHHIEAFISDQIAQDNEQREEICKNDKWCLLNDVTANLPIELQHFSKSSN